MIRKKQYLSSSKVSYLDLEVRRANTARLDTKFGAGAVTMTNIKPHQEAEIVYRDADTGYIYQDKDSAGRAEVKAIKELRRPFIPKRIK